LPSKDSDATADHFLAALKERDFAAAAAKFDATVKAALSQEKLAAVWDSQVAIREVVEDPTGSL